MKENYFWRKSDRVREISSSSKAKWSSFCKKNEICKLNSRELPQKRVWLRPKKSIYSKKIMKYSTYFQAKSKEAIN